MDNAETNRIKGIPLEFVQEEIDKAFVLGFKNTTAQNLLLIKYKLIEMANEEPSSSIIIYWLVYCIEHLAIIYGILKESDKEEREIKEGVTLLENIPDKNSEDLALLALMGGYSVKYANVFKISKLIEKYKAYANEALMLDKDNIRAYLALGVFDFNTPLAYGGGKVLEEKLNIAISLKDESSSYAPYSPKWGKNMAYIYLIRYYMKCENKDMTNKYFDEALNLYPNDRILTELKKEFKR